MPFKRVFKRRPVARLLGRDTYRPVTAVRIDTIACLLLRVLERADRAVGAVLLAVAIAEG